MPSEMINPSRCRLLSSDLPEDLEGQVNEALEVGYRLHGSMSVSVAAYEEGTTVEIEYAL